MSDDQRSSSEIQLKSEAIQLDPSEVSSPALARLIEEVRQEKGGNVAAYNRTHNRHNRGR